jgi:hypothetical protein
VNAKVKPGDTTVVVSWQEPEPNCPTKPSPDNPKTSESLSVGTYTRTYKYTYSIPEIRSFDIECHVNIVVTGMLNVHSNAYLPGAGCSKMGSLTLD